LSLTLPDGFNRSTTNENWIFCLGYDDSFDMVGTSNQLDEDVNTTETEIDVDDGSLFTAGNYYRMNTIGTQVFTTGELIKVTSISSDTLTVERSLNGIENSPAQSSTTERIFNNSFTPVSFTDTTIDDRFSHGAVLSNPSIRESISLKNSTSKTGNISIQLANFLYEGKPFSEEIFGGTRKYINRICKVFVQLNDNPYLHNALQVYSGRLVNFSHNQDNITLDIVAHDPFENIEVPQVKTSKNNYFPIAYGDYTANASQGNSQSVSLTFGSSAGIDEFRKRKTLYPMPVEQRRGDTIFSLTGLRSINQNAYPHYYEKSVDSFLPIANHASTMSSVDVDNEVFGSGYAVKHNQSLLKGQFVKPLERTDSGSSTNFVWAENDNAFNADYIDTSSYTQCLIQGNFTADDNATIKFKMPQLTGVADTISIHLIFAGSVSLSSSSGTGEIRIQLIDESFGASDILGYYSITNEIPTTTFNQTSGGTLATSSFAYFTNQNDSDSEFNSSSNGWGEEIKLKMKAVQQSGSLDGTLGGYLRLADVVIEVKSKLDYSDQDKKSNSYKIIDDIDTLYCGANGLKDVSSWGGDALITKIVFAHRDLLQRFGNFKDGNSVPYDSAYDPINWDSGTNISVVKDWLVRYWITEPKPLTNCLEELQKNGGFIGRYNAQGDYTYVYIPDSISTDHTLTKDDISDLNIQLTPFDDVVTSMDIEYEKHPVNGKGYVSKVEASNSSNITAFNVDTNEKKRTVRLNALVSAPASTPSSNVNDDYYTYFDNIFSQKLIITFNVVNQTYYKIDIGDFVAFGDVGTNAFASSFSGKNFIVTNINRKLGSLGVTVNEV
tara:strand:- start:2769 stop:5270 length:2502 start_codon:yes stop_codon:yes gene_type:complete